MGQLSQRTMYISTQVDEGRIFLNRKQARANFFQHTIKHVLKQASQQEQQSAIRLFPAETGNDRKQMKADLSELGLQKYQKQITKLLDQFSSIQEQYDCERECPQIQQIIKCNYSNLRTICIVYQSSKVRRRYFCSISSFEFFKAVNQNKQLKEATIKGVQMKYLSSFMSIIRSIHQQLSLQLKPEQKWIISFSPNKLLQLTLHSLFLIDIQRSNKADSFINDFTYFIQQFHSLSHITVRIELPKWKSINQSSDTLNKLFNCLKLLKKLQIKIEAIGNKNEISLGQIGIIRSMLFGGLISFTQIIQLTFKRVKFGNDVDANNLLAIGQILNQIFINNPVTYLQLFLCSRFPDANMKTLEQIKLTVQPFSKHSSFVNSVIHHNPRLKSIKCIQMLQQWDIDGQLISKLQTLSIQGCNRINFANIVSPSASNIKHLIIDRSKIGSCLSQIFKRLTNLTLIRLNCVNFDFRLLGAIPSPYLQLLYIRHNNTVTAQGVLMVDKKWPNLREFSLCIYGLNESVWKMCQFQGLIYLSVDRQSLKETTIEFVKSKGIKINYGL